jgi:hypothetical protein
MRTGMHSTKPAEKQKTGVARCGGGSRLAVTDPTQFAASHPLRNTSVGRRLIAIRALGSPGKEIAVLYVP